jgi:hypothetical protein
LNHDNAAVLARVPVKIAAGLIRFAQDALLQKPPSPPRVVPAKKNHPFPFWEG